METSTRTNPAPPTDAGGRHAMVEASVTSPGTETEPNLHVVAGVWKKSEPITATAVVEPLTAPLDGITEWTPPSAWRGKLTRVSKTMRQRYSVDAVAAARAPRARAIARAIVGL